MMLINGLIALIIIFLNALVLLLVSFVGIKFSKIRILNVICMREYFISMLSTVLISYLFNPTIAAVLFVAIFFLYRNVFFMNDSFEVQRLYNLYDGHFGDDPIQKFSGVLKSKYTCDRSLPIEKDFLYSFDRYLNNTLYIFVFYITKNIEYQGNAVLYGFDYFIAITALFIVIAKSIYYLTLKKVSSLFFEAPIIPVIFAGILFYGVFIVVFVNLIRNGAFL